ncbi:hypothetical protein [Nonomuraea sp. NPDC050310]|uniref:hypothetical protein n=1 Tax=Nonomuraea sp. NPDC050310 TaxID=3154935 RepID=UPI0033CB0EA1
MAGGVGAVGGGGMAGFDPAGGRAQARVLGGDLGQEVGVPDGVERGRPLSQAPLDPARRNACLDHLGELFAWGARQAVAALGGGQGGLGGEGPDGEAVKAGRRRDGLQLAVGQP